MSKSGINTKPFKHEVGEIITNGKGQIQLTSRFRGKVKEYERHNHKYYTYKCLKDSYEGIISEWSITNGGGCLVCGGSRVVEGYNDIATTNPERVNDFYNPEDAKRYSMFSNTKADFRCNKCGKKIPHKSVHVMMGRTEDCICPVCKKNIIPIGEKILWSIFSQLEINFKHDESTEWSELKRYDFILPEINTIIEVNGLQHYEDTSLPKLKNKTVKDVQENDEYKKYLALINGIEHYIYIDARDSKFISIKESILCSKLSELLDLSNIDWNQVRKEAIPPDGKKILELWNSGIKSTEKIGQLINHENKWYISTILHEYAAIGECDYSEEKARTGFYVPEDESKAGSPKMVICLNTLEVFSKGIYASRLYNASHLASCLTGKRNASGKHPETGEKLHWQYFEDYIKEHNIEDVNSFLEKHLHEPVYSLLPKEYRRKMKNKYEFNRPTYSQLITT